MYKKIIAIIISIGLLSITGSYLGCSKKKEKKDPEIKKQMQLIEEMKIKREYRSMVLKEMDVKQLIQELSTESQRGLEPFNSIAYKEVIARGSQVVVPELSSSLQSTEKSFLLGLLALREINRDEYKKLDTLVRIKTPIDALEKAKFFNVFGIPHLYWEQAAKAIIEEGEGAKEYLIPLLKNMREAPAWGSEGTVINSIYKYRVCDYAWKMLLDIDQRQIEIPKNILERDSLINEYIDSSK